MKKIDFKKMLAGAAAGALVSLLAGCTLTNYNRESCTANSDCAEFGGICQEDGYCSESTVLESCSFSSECYAANGFGTICDDDTNRCRDLQEGDIEPRCDKTEPADLFTNLEAHRNRIVFATGHNTGASATHRGREAGVRAGILEINKGTAIRDEEGNERRFGLVMCDSFGDDAAAEKDYPDALSRSDASVRIADWTVNTLGLAGFIGPAGSSDTIRAYSEVIERAGGRAMQVANGAASPALTTVDAASFPNPSDDEAGLLWRTSSSGEGQGIVMANYFHNMPDDFFGSPNIRSQATRRIALIHETGAFGAGIASAFLDEYQAITGGRNALLIDVSYDDSDQDDMRAKVDGVKAQIANVDGILFAGQASDHVAFLAHISDDPIWNARINLPLFFPQTAISPAVFSGVDAADNQFFDQVFAANPSVAVGSSSYNVFESAFIDVDEDSRNPASVSQSAQSWDAAWMLASGAAWALLNTGKADGQSIARGIRRLIPTTLPNTDATIPDVIFNTTGWAVMLGRFRNGEDNRVDAAGATGELSYDLTTEEKPTEITIIRSVNNSVPFDPVQQCDEQLVCSNI